MSDFDFAIGSWNVANRHLRRAFTGCTEWVSYPSTVTCWSIFDGNGTMDEVVFPTHGTRAMTNRSSRRTTAARGSRTGSWSSLARKHARAPAAQLG